MTTAAAAAPSGRNATVALLSGGAVLLLLVLALVVGPGAPSTPGEGAGAPTSEAPAAPVTSGTGSDAATSAAPAGTAGPPTPSVPPEGPPTSAAVVPATPRAAAPEPAAPEPVPPEPVPPAGPGGATPAPAWLGTRALAPAGSGPVGPQTTPGELLDRRLVTRDLLPPPPDNRFAPMVQAVPADVLARSTWHDGCPVEPADLRYLTVQHLGFDGRWHTGEVLVHADAVDAVLAVFAAMHAERFPLEEVRVVRDEELDAAPTGDGNVTSAFVCRDSVGGGGWSGHAYGRALDVNPFHNPYDRGSGADRVVLPELATAYTDRSRALPGMLGPSSGAVRAAEAAGWGWGGRWDSAKDWMHLSDDGR